MIELVNLALGKPATQSSICTYSVGHSQEEDASVAVSGDLTSEATFHTDIEASPWWEVDLSEVCEVTVVIIDNRKSCPERFRNFSILHSTDHVEWQTAFRKADPRVFFSLEVPFRRPLHARWLRIRLDGHQCLHLRQVQVIGRSVGADASEAGRSTLFSVLYNESTTFIATMLDNFTFYTGSATRFVVNLPASFLAQIDELPRHPRVHYLRASRDRRSSGADLLLGHLESCRVGTAEFGSMDYFAPLASNCLFVRHYEPSAAETVLLAGEQPAWHAPEAPLCEGPDGPYLDIAEWHYPSIGRQPALLAFLQELGLPSIVPAQIEGLWAPMAQWQALADLFERIQEIATQFDPNFLFPMEEVLPGTLFAHAFGHRFVSICQVLWFPPRTQVPMEQVLQPDWYFPPHVCSAKWFERDAFRPEVASISTARGRELVALISQQLNLGNIDDLLVYGQLLGEFSRAIEVLAAEGVSYRIRI